MKKYAFLVGVLVLAVALVGGCGESAPVGAAEGDTVSVHYTGSLDDGTVFDSSLEREPLTFVVGGGGVISGFDEAVRGMAVGETKTVTIPATEAYGEYREELLVTLPLEDLPEELVLGQKVPLQNVTSGETINFTVVDISDTEATLDANHRLAGEALTFEITVVAIEVAVKVN
ncbi:MAG: FKBP-type peptidyl-prolyl cis-trans isomerase [Dehalococcoidia bacterium]|jgi:peptidylprolyl isomerase